MSVTQDFPNLHTVELRGGRGGRRVSNVKKARAAESVLFLPVRSAGIDRQADMPGLAENLSFQTGSTSEHSSYHFLRSMTRLELAVAVAATSLPRPPLRHTTPFFTEPPDPMACNFSGISLSLRFFTRSPLQHYGPPADRTPIPWHLVGRRFEDRWRRWQ